MATDFPVSKLTELADRYLTQRDNYVARFRARESGLIALSEGGALRFNDLLNEFYKDLGRVMPADQTLAQMEALSELFSGALNQRRALMAQDAGRL